jgi:peptide deformylase
MALREIVLEGDPRLRQKASKVRGLDRGIRQLAEDMYETMLDAPGVGLAAPQVGVPLRLIAIEVPAGYVAEDDPGVPRLILLNPEIVKQSGSQLEPPEGCLSIPNWIGTVPRAGRVIVKARDLDFKEVRIRAEGFLARVLQHELDHLDGILFTDRVVDKSTLKYVPPTEAGERAGAAAVALAE